MTVSSETRRADYLGDSSTTNFATGFRFLQNQDLKVIVTVTATGVESEKVLNTDYTVTGAGLDAGGTVTMIVAPVTGEKLSILRNVAITQETDYVENDPFPAESHERALDKLTMVVQQQQDDIDRSLKLQESQTSTGLTVPAPSVNLFLQWDANGNLKNTDIATQGSIAITDYGRTLVNTVDAAAARVVLEAPKLAVPSAAGNVSALLANGDNSDTGKSSDLIIPTADAAGTAQAITATYTPTVTLADKTRVRLTALLANTATAPAFSPNGLTAHPIVKLGGQALAAGDIAGPGHELDLVYDLSNTRWELLNPGSTGQVLQGFKSDIFSTTSTSFIDIPGLSVTITPSSTASKILVSFELGTVDSSTSARVGFRLVRDSTPIGVGDAAGNRKQTSSAITSNASRGGTLSNEFLDSPSLDVAITYKVQAYVDAGTLYLNYRGGSDGDSSSIYRSASSITVQEVA